MKVTNMTSNRTGREVPNQFDIVGDEGNIYFQSYRTVIVAIKKGQVYLDHNWDYSKTTSKYRNQFLGETRKETEAKIKDGTYTVTNLN
uniref:DUF8033 domain-containing protein n=1 Tax=viral metagenome TaxID=1070528 RepID=A0A6M3LD33_9ZZZZ